MASYRISTEKNLYAPQRHELIVDLVESRGRVEVSSLAQELGVTPETVRRDLTILERLGKLRRVHGGALPVAQMEGEPSLLERLGRNREAKKRIAQRALLEMPSQGTLLLDSGTTTLAVVHALPDNFSLDVITNSVVIAALLAERSNLSVHVLGGKIRHRTGALVGEWTQSALDDICVDLAILGTNAITIEQGMTTPNQTEAAVKRAMVKSARRTIVVSDSSKVGLVRTHRFAQLAEIAMLITDCNLDDETAAEFDKKGMEVVRV